MARILVVDDDQAHRLAHVAVLEAAGHEVVECDDAAKAPDACREHVVDVVMTDLQMPEVHGLELITLLRDLSPRPMIIVVSGTGANQLSVAESLGADATLSKPVTADRLLGAVDEVLAVEEGAPTLVLSDPPHRHVDLDAAAAYIGLDVFQTRLKFIFPAPEILAASDARRASHIASSFQAAGVRVGMVDGQDVAAIPWPNPVSRFAFSDGALTATLRGGDVDLPYDAQGVAVFCTPPSDMRPKGRRAAARPQGIDESALPEAGPAAVEAIERMGNLDLYFVRDDALRRISIVDGLTNFSGLGDQQRRTQAENLEATLVECQRRFGSIEFDTRLENVRPRRRYAPDDSGENPDMRKRYSFGTPMLREALASISPELSDLTQYELGSRLGYVTTRDRPL